MIKKTVNYVDFDGNNRTEDLYFNLTRTELVDMAIDLPDGVSAKLAANVDKDAIDEVAAVEVLKEFGNKGIFNFIKTLVLNAYGVKSEDGRRFIKKPEITEEFSQTLAYDAIITELMSTDEAASNFVNAIIPADIAGKMPALTKQ